MKPIAATHPHLADALVSLGCRVANLVEPTYLALIDRAFWTFVFGMLGVAAVGLVWASAQGWLS